MTLNDHFLPSFHPYHEMQTCYSMDDIPMQISAGLSIIRPTIENQYFQSGGVIRLGLTDDDFSVILNLYNPAPGPLLVTGDAGCGKTTFLQSLALTTIIQDTGDIQFGVLTPFLEEWSTFENLPGCLGIWPANHSASQSFLSQLISWSEALHQTRQAVLLLLDDLDLSSINRYKLQNDLHWLLMHGPERHIWPVMTVNPGRLFPPCTLLDLFRTRILGHIKRAETTLQLVDDPETDLVTLLPGKQFCLAHTDGWLKFWLPPI